MVIRARYLTGCAALALAAVAVVPPVSAIAPQTSAIDPARLQAAEQTPNDWLTYHGGYKSYHYSALDQINADNVKNLQVAWIHMPGRSTRGRSRRSDEAADGNYRTSAGQATSGSPRRLVSESRGAPAILDTAAPNAAREGANGGLPCLRCVACPSSA